MIKEINNIKETHTLCNEAKMIFAGNSNLIAIGYCFKKYLSKSISYNVNIFVVLTFKQSFNSSLNISIEVFTNADFENAGMK